MEMSTSCFSFPHSGRIPSTIEAQRGALLGDKIFKQKKRINVLCGGSKTYGAPQSLQDDVGFYPADALRVHYWLWAARCIDVASHPDRFRTRFEVRSQPPATTFYLEVS